MLELPQEEQLVLRLPQEEQLVLKLPQEEPHVLELPQEKQPELKLPQKWQPVVVLPQWEQPEVNMPQEEQPVVKLPQREQHMVELPQEEQPMMELLYANEGRWHWQEPVPPKLESFLKEELMKMKLPRRWGSEAAASTHPLSLAFGQKLPSEEKIFQETCRRFRSQCVHKRMIVLSQT
jgi:hypothetical protein